MTHIPLVVCGLLLFPFKGDSSSVVRYRTNLGFYGGYSTDHRSILYSNSDVEDWKNLNQLKEDGGLERKALLCGMGTGTWLAYPENNFQSANNGSNYAMLLIGDACVPADNINSVQAVSPILREPHGILTFTEPYFNSDGVWTTNETKSTTNVKSLICPEDISGEWTLEGDGKKVCVIRPKDLVATGVCIFPDIPTQLNIQSATLTVGCENVPGKDVFNRNGSEVSTSESENVTVDGTTVFVLQTCFGSYGAYKIVDNYLPLPQLTAVCNEKADGSHKLGFYKIVDAWKFRMNADRQQEMNPADIDIKRQDQNTPTRMKILTHFFGIFKIGCPNIPEIYFNLLRYLFMQHLKSVWEEVPTVIQDRNDTALTWKTAAEAMQLCYKIRIKDGAGNNGQKPKPKEFACINKKRYTGHNAKDWQESAMDLFLSGDNLDHVIEQVWLILNYVSPYCAAVKRFSDNFWAEFTNMFRRNFLLPVLQQWIHPGTWQVYYDYIFSGFSLQKGKRQIIACLQDLLMKTPLADPVDRPSATIKMFSQLSKKKSPVDTSTMNKTKTDTTPSSNQTVAKTAPTKSRKKREINKKNDDNNHKSNLSSQHLIRKTQLSRSGKTEHEGKFKKSRKQHG